MSVLRRDRPTRGGGVAIYYSNALKCEPLTSSVLPISDVLICHLQLSGRDKCLMVVLYRPPNSSQDNDENIISLLRYITSMRYSHYLIMGDFNVPTILSSCITGPPFKSKLLDLFNVAPLYNHINRPTRYRGLDNPSVLDLVLTNEELMIESVVYNTPLGSSDHIILTFDYICYALVTDQSLPDRRTVTDYTLLHSLAASTEWTIAANSSPNDSWNTLKDRINEVICKASHVSLARRTKSTNPWIRSRTKKWIVRRNETWSWYTDYPCDSTWKEYTSIRNYCTALIRDDKSTWQTSMARKFTNNNKLLYKFVNEARKVKHGIPPLMTDNGLTTSFTEAANALLKQFNLTTSSSYSVPRTPYPVAVTCFSQVEFTPATVTRKLLKLRQNSAPGVDGIRPKVLTALANSLSEPLAELFQQSFNTGALPSEWQKGVITPIYKGGRRSDPANYRPITLLPVVSKVMESIIADSLSEYFESLQLLSTVQHGFRQRRSCLTNLITVRDYWTKEVDLGHEVDVVYLDFSKAFDRVQHSVLLRKLFQYGISGPMLTWIESYLHGRSSTVRVCGAYSEKLPVTMGVPQGSVLGPLLFLVHINDLPKHVQSHIAIFADDAKISRAIISQDDRTILQGDLDRIYAWSVANQLPLNPDKCHVLTLRGATQYPYRLGTVILQRVTCEKDLGLIVQSDLGNSLQCARASSTANSHLRLLKRVFGTFEPHIFHQLINLYIRPHVEYAVQAWSPWLKRDISALERPQRRATKCVRGLSQFTYEDRLRTLNLFSLEYRRIRGDLILTYQILTEPDHPCKSILMPAPSNRCRGHNMKLTHQHARLDCRKFSFSLRICDKWNSLPSTVVNAPNLTKFKQLLDSHFTDAHYMIS